MQIFHTVRKSSEGQTRRRERVKEEGSKLDVGLEHLAFWRLERSGRENDSGSLPQGRSDRGGGMGGFTQRHEDPKGEKIRESLLKSALRT